MVVNFPTDEVILISPISIISGCAAMIAITDYLAGVPLFLAYFALALLLTGIYVVVYAR